MPADDGVGKLRANLRAEVRVVAEPASLLVQARAPSEAAARPLEWNL